MLFQLNFSKEIYVLLFLTILILGIQLSLYVIYGVLRAKKEDLPTNKKFMLFGLVLTFFGNIFTLILLFSILNYLPTLITVDYIYIYFSICLILLIIGFIIALMGLFTFPSLYGYKWDKNILKLFIINQEDNKCLYSYDFVERKSDTNQKDYEKIFSVGIVGIDMILSEITNTKRETMNKIKQSDSLILLEYGSGIVSQIIYVLVVKKDRKSNRIFLKSIKNNFESFYREILKELKYLKGSEEQLFGSFDIIIKDMIY
jgi:hypothetical protein